MWSSSFTGPEEILTIYAAHEKLPIYALDFGGLHVQGLTPSNKHVSRHPHVYLNTERLYTPGIEAQSCFLILFLPFLLSSSLYVPYLPSCDIPPRPSR